ncbi:hypothetical protein [Streptomyces sp. cmx-4-9]|uniref:hypothetical protein n=1 Tax=Streptomyces sp. cmx-4-9 TaxID=2790941 RepID=UPI0039810AE3
MGAMHDKREQPDQPGNGPDEAAERKGPGQDPARRRRSSHHLDEETKRRREEDMVKEGDVEGDEL